jgi:hypothetical protein
MCDNLNSEEQHHLLKLLQKYEHLFDGKLEEFNMDPISQYMPAHILSLEQWSSSYVQKLLD